MADENTDNSNYGTSPAMAALPEIEEHNTQTSVRIAAVERLRAFEDEHFPDAVRIRDQIEKGSGSPFQLAKPEVRAQHAALEKLIEAEVKLAAAHTALIQADTDYEAALAATEPKPNAPSE